ncbi:MAG: NDP-sugar synthase [Candidatus Poribacteria bacterium]|jgi:bifunctional UDP-N-acetylglucosamine pyrophosphorylase/glucosamine-1-phosphate N-acetyltransferase|nr:NDP-sugar synthase [Candidatus Poribacteria bacterium]MDP6748268.1 NDP-sugar synthase [Candidatus Poribacteria bacterium]MDP6995273.1 NDP-sugar synthase [Candidatus Poribacteria bacterium]
MKTSAVILAAGSGGKVWPYGEFRQKCTLPVCNTPIVRRLAQQLSEIGVQRITIVVGHYGQQVIGVTADLPGVEFIEQKSLDGTASAAYQAIQSHSESEQYLILYGDLVTNTDDLRRLLNQFQETDAEACALVNHLGPEDPANWICAGVGNDQITGVEGHPRGGSYRLCGIYGLRQSAVGYLRQNPGVATPVPVGGMPPPEAEIAHSIQLMVDADRSVLAVQTEGFFVDVDKPWHLLEANHRLMSHFTQQIEQDRVAEGAEISDGADIHGHVVLGRNSRIGKRVIVKGNLIAGANNSITNGAILGSNLFIGDQCRISDYCDVGSSVVGNRCIIGHGAEMSGVLFDKVYLYHYCEMSGIFGTATDIGAATVCGTLRFDDGDTAHKINGRYETPTYGANATYMGEYCRTGVNAIIMPGRKIGSYSVVGAGVVLNEDVPSKTMISVKQELVRKPWGPERYGW